MKAYQKQATWAGLTFFIGVLGTVAVLVTLRWTVRSVTVSERNAAAAELAVKESSRALEHARSVAERDLRPWLTISAKIDSDILVDKLGTIEERISDKVTAYEFFSDFQFQNVGRSAARNVFYIVKTTNRPEEQAISWFDDAVFTSTAYVRNEIERASRLSGDTLTPSEIHRTRRWCDFTVKEWSPGDKVMGQFIQIHVAVIAVYTGNSKDVLVTAKLLPVGFPQVPTFLSIMSWNRLPVRLDEVVFGPAITGAAE